MNNIGDKFVIVNYLLQYRNENGTWGYSLEDAQKYDDTESAKKDTIEMLTFAVPVDHPFIKETHVEEQVFYLVCENTGRLWSANGWLVDDIDNAYRTHNYQTALSAAKRRSTPEFTLKVCSKDSLYTLSNNVTIHQDSVHPNIEMLWHVSKGRGVSEDYMRKIGAHE